MSILVIGSIALDTVETPFGRVKETVGGSAIYFSLAASYFVNVNVVGVVGNDFPKSIFKLLNKRGIDTRGIVMKTGKTFRWKGRYDFDLNTAHTLETHLNVFSDFKPKIPVDYSSSEYVFLGNIHPELQLSVLKSVNSPKLIACDTMNYWIEKENSKLKKVLRNIDMIIINEAEARELAGEPNTIRAVKKILTMGPKYIIIKRGEYGAMFFSRKSIFVLPAFPLERLFDPTGAGDSFAGGFLGYIAKCMDTSEDTMRQAIVAGSVIASFNVEDFGIKRLCGLNYKEISERLKFLKNLVSFKEMELNASV